MKLKNINKKRIIGGFYSIFIFMLTIGITIFSGILYKLETSEIIRLSILMFIGCGSIVFEQGFSVLYKKYSFDNEEHPFRFFMIYVGCLILASIFPMFPISGLPYLFIALILSLFSNVTIGILSFSNLLVLTSLLGNASIDHFFLYFICGLITILLFSKINDDFHVGIPVFLSLCIFLVSHTANILLFSFSILKIEMFIIPIVNIFLNGILMLICLRFYSYHVVHKYREKYMEINDPEYDILVELKIKNKNEYYHSVHTAYLSDKIARRLHLDAEASRASGYYHRLYKYRNEKEDVYGMKLQQEYYFPIPACNVINELNSKHEKLISKEAVVVYMSDTVVDSIIYLFDKDKNAILNYHEIIELLFKKKIEKGILDSCELTMAEIKEMKKIFMEETLYYDFLR